VCEHVVISLGFGDVIPNCEFLSQELQKHNHQHNTNISRLAGHCVIVTYSQSIDTAKTNKQEGRGKVLFLQDAICLVDI
jgi:hypothetical protein